MRKKTPKELEAAEDREDLEAARAARAEIESGEDEVIPWKEAKAEMGKGGE